MAKLIAIGAHFYQAIIAFGLLLAVSHLLKTTDYTAYSFFISLSQFAATFCFEWIRSAVSRFYPGQTAQSEAMQRHVLTVEFGLCAVLCLGMAAALPAFGIPLITALTGSIAAIFLAGSDIHLTMIRFRQQFQLFSLLQALRATILAAATLIGLAIDRRFEGAAFGLVAGSLVYALVAAALSRRHVSAGGRWSTQAAREHVVYGGVTASSATINMLAPLGLKSILTALLGPQQAAGAMLALDLLQRPFVLIFAALYAIQFPEVVALYDREGAGPAMRCQLGRYYALLTSASFMMAAGTFAILRPVTAWLIAPGLQHGFLQAAPFVVVAALTRALSQNMLPTASQLRRHLLSIFLLAAMDCELVNVLALVSAWAFGPSNTSIMAGAAAGALLATGYGLIILLALPFDMIWGSVILSIAGCAISTAAFAIPFQNIYLSAAIAIAGGGCFCLIALVRIVDILRTPPAANSV
jgi:hypothetical protein